MGELSKIAWTHATFNPWIGCTKVSPACDHCYAESGSRRLGAQHGLSLWQGDRYFTGRNYWRQPHRWNRAAEKAGERRRVFCASFADVFEGRSDLDASREGLWTVISETPWLDWLLLTKRPENIRRMIPAYWRINPPRNVWYGTTAEDQQRANERIPDLLATPAAVRFVSYEPALGPVDFTRIADVTPGGDCLNALDGKVSGSSWRFAKLDWVIVGGESGHGARPFEICWARDVLDQCRRHGTACFIKQLGRVPSILGVPVRYVDGDEPGWEGGSLKDPKGGDWDEWPPELRVREFPTPRIAA